MSHDAAVRDAHHVDAVDCRLPRDDVTRARDHGTAGQLVGVCHDRFSVAREIAHAELGWSAGYVHEGAPVDGVRRKTRELALIDGDAVDVGAADRGHRRSVDGRVARVEIDVAQCSSVQISRGSALAVDRLGSLLVAVSRVGRCLRRRRALRPRLARLLRRGRRRGA